ncbi:craniofacial development protein 2-like [Macrobrachium nipponense]|uniref:craniofacial development protein 2-like n=1 Tax=Macrobrachium nipponense TaxID=159736 RepID=UPI0030C7E2E0
MGVMNCSSKGSKPQPEDSDDDEKDDFYEKLQEVVEQTPKHDIVVHVVLGDFNVKIGHEVDILGLTIGRHGAHEVSSENGIGLASFANSSGMVVGGAIFSHREIHQLTWNSLDGNTRNQIDHILIQHKSRGSLLDVCSLKGVDCDSDQHLGLQENCGDIEQIVVEAAEETIGYVKSTRNKHWFGGDCRRIIASERKRTKDRILAEQELSDTRRQFREKRRAATRINRRKKREALNKEPDDMAREKHKKWYNKGRL